MRTGMATNADLRFLTPEEFLAIDFGSELKAELDNGVIRMMAGGSLEHARVQANLMRWLGTALRGSGCRPYGSDAAVRTTPWSVRYPDVTIDCATDQGREAETQEKHLRAPRVIFEVLSPGTRALDEGAKLIEYRQMAGVDTIVLIDPLLESVRVLHSHATGHWIDRSHAEPHDLELRSLHLTMPRAEIFARD